MSSSVTSPLIVFVISIYAFASSGPGAGVGDSVGSTVCLAVGSAVGASVGSVVGASQSPMIFMNICDYYF